MTRPALGLAHGYAEGEGAAPVLLLLHGTGGTPQDLVDLGRELSPRSALLAPAGPVSENGAARWFRRRAEGVFDEDDVLTRTHELAEFVQRAREHHGITDRPLVAVGFSNGANIAAALLLLRPEVLGAAVLFSSMLPLTEPPEAELSGSRVWLSNGAHDPMAPIDSADRLVGALRERNAEVETHRHAGGHRITAEAVQQAAAWLAG